MFVTILYYVTAFLLSLTILVVTYSYYAFSYWKSRGMPHLPPKFPFGNGSSEVAKYIGSIVADIYHQLKERGYEYAGIYIFTSAMFMPISPELIKLILLKHSQQFDDHGIYIDLERDRMAANLVTLYGQKWKEMRTKLTPVFSPGRTKLMVPLLIECCQDFGQILANIANKEGYFDCYEFATRYFTDVISSCAFGIKSNTIQNPNSDLKKYGKMALDPNFSNIVRLRLVMTFPGICRLFKINMFSSKATNFFLKVVQDTIAYRVENNIRRPDFLDTLIQNRKKSENDSEGMDDIEIAANTFVVYLAGFETSATVAAFCLCELAHNQDIQNKVRNEIEQVLKDENNELTYEVFAKMKYLEKVIYETLRVYPSISILDRMCTEDFTIPGTSIVIEKGTRTLIPVSGIHKDPEYYPNPEKFDPERFNEENVSKRKPFTYLPFGEGHRICPGYRFGVLQIKVYLVSMLKNFHYSLHSSIQLPLRTCNVGNVSHPVDTLLINIRKI